MPLEIRYELIVVGDDRHDNTIDEQSDMAHDDTLIMVVIHTHLAGNEAPL